jgi:hypothetical protein
MRISLDKDAATRVLAVAERERFPRAGDTLRSRAASGKRPAGIMTGLRL